MAPVISKNEDYKIINNMMINMIENHKKNEMYLVRVPS